MALQALLIMIIATQAAALPRKMLGGFDFEDPVPTVGRTDVQTGNQLLRSTGSAAGDIVQNYAQAQVQQGLTDTVTTTVANSRKAGQVDSDTRMQVGSSAASGAIINAAGGGSAYNAAKENQAISSVTMYGQGMRLSTDNRQQLATQAAQSAVAASLNGGSAFTATDEGANSAWAAASASKSHDYGGYSP